MFENARADAFASMTSLQDDLAVLERDFPDSAEYEKKTARQFIDILNNTLGHLDKAQDLLNNSKSVGAAFEFTANDFAAVQQNSRSDENLGERIDLANEHNAARKELSSMSDNLRNLYDELRKNVTY